MGDGKSTNFPYGLSCHNNETAANVLELPSHANSTVALNGATARNSMAFYNNTAKQLQLFANNAWVDVIGAAAATAANNAAAFTATHRFPVVIGGNTYYIPARNATW